MNFHDENGHEYVTPYNVFEAIHGAYDPDASPVVIFSNWMREEKAEYLKQFPKVDAIRSMDIFMIQS